MEAASFPQANTVLDPPPGMTLDDCTVLNVWRGITPDNIPVVVSCWKPSKEELEQIQKTGRVWLWVWGQTMPPVALDVDHPFGK